MFRAACEVTPGRSDRLVSKLGSAQRDEYAGKELSSKVSLVTFFVNKRNATPKSGIS
jgi:hypothetical protein